MKSRIKKIIISVATLLFVFSGVSFAHDSQKRNHKRQGNAYGHHKAEKHHSGWRNKHFKPWKDYRMHSSKHHLAGYICEYGFYHYYDKGNRRWKNDHLKQKRHHRDKYSYKRDHRPDEDYYRRHAPREDVVYKVKLKDPKIVFKVIKRDHY